jgi:outer membrane protein OmpA-like peptidoglycan-associated protein
MNSKLFAAVVVVLAAPVLAQSRVPAFELERLTLNPSALGGLLVGAGDVLPAHEYRLSLTGHYEHDPLVYVDSAGQRLATVVGSRVTAQLTGAYSVSRRIELGLQLPIVAWQGRSQGLEDVGLVAPQSTALGTPWVQGRVMILSQSEGDPLDLAAGALLGIPLGSGAALARDNGVSFIPRVGAGRRVSDFTRVGAELGAWIRPAQTLSPDNAARTDQLGSQLDLGLGVSTLGEGLRGELSLRTLFPLTPAPLSAELMAGVRYPVGVFELFALAGPGFGRAPGTPMFRVLLGAAFRAGQAPAPVVAPLPVAQVEPVKPQPLPAPEAKCVEGKPYALAECPDLDLDGDGVKNAVDRCPKVAGTVDGCPDRDHDGVDDERDQCPDVAGLPSLGGCPDTDKDGVIDSLDQCPTVPGPPERHGCPPKDTDGDGVIDEEDECPTEPGPKELRGCPVRDADGDGVPDAEDNCPAEPGPKSNQGCPEAKKQLVIITREKLVIKDRVYFDTGKAVIQKRSFVLLDQVASILNEHPEVKKLVVEGHTDSKGKAEANRKLSQARAESVRARLVKQGVALERLDAIGYGPDRPVGDNKTAAGREQNRRVEFVIVAGEKSETKVIESP